ncbi:MAG: hypothetical protein ACD_77C00339G0004 [uncultured bacterium]|nr:MAG: hypothetical protein ACD_77C00339G0004 [uncultured bacterium]
MRLTRHIITFVLCFAAIDVTAQTINTATYNIRYENKSDSLNGNGWGQRLPVIVKLIQFHDFDIFGAQEVFYGQLNGMLTLMPEYGFIGVGRTDGEKSGECSPVFYKKDKFKLMQSGNFWLSETDSKPGVGWDAALPRICTWGKFQIKENGVYFWYFNLHMDHIGVKARLESSRLVIEKIKTLAGSEPVILTGDFNSDQKSEGYKLISSTGILQDSYETAEVRYAANGTFNNFNPQQKTDIRIDHIFVSKGFRVMRYGILTDTYWTETVKGSFVTRMPSDHFPVKVVVTLEKKNGNNLKNYIK